MVKSLTPTTLRRSGQRGFTLLELAVVVVIVSILVFLALGKYLELLVDVERSTMEYNLGSLRSAVTLQMAERLVKGDQAGAASLVGSNPMRYLTEAPGNYLGEFDSPDPEAMEPGSWFFDRKAKVLHYRVKNDRYFEPGLPPPPQARFEVRAVLGGEGDAAYLAGVTLAPLEPYSWLKEPKR